MKNRYTVCLLGASLETGNRGVSALAASTVKIIRSIKPDATFYFLGGNKEKVHRVVDDNEMRIETTLVNYRLSPKAKLKEHIIVVLLSALIYKYIPFAIIKKFIFNKVPCVNLLVRSDFIGSIHGGDSFSDIYGLKRFIYSIIPDLLSIIVNNKIILLPQTYGPYKSWAAKKIAFFIIKKSKYIISRDIKSVDYLKEIYGRKIDPVKIKTCPDVAFCLGVKRVKNCKIDEMIENKDRIVGLNINGLMYKGGFNQKNMFGLKSDYKIIIDDFIEKIISMNNTKIILIPHTYGPKGSIDMDPEVCERVYNKHMAKYPNRIILVNEEYDQSEIKYIISYCDFFIGSRMHACIAAISLGIPTIAIAYSRKFEGVFRMVNIYDSVIDAKKENEEEAISKLLIKFKEKPDKNTFINGVEKGKQETIEVFKDITT